MKYAEISKETVSLLYQSRASLTKSPLNGKILILAELRVSQINGCAYCCQLHTAEARKIGIPQEKLDILPGWRNAHVFTDEENLVLRFAEAMTHMDKDVRQIREELAKIYTERQLADLTICIGLMNALNRIEISLHD